MYCKNCGKEVKDDWNMCPYCKAKLNENAGMDYVRTDNAGQKKEGMESNEETKYNTARYSAFRYSTDKEKGKIKYRSFWMYLLLGFVTGGIYSLYVMWHLIKDINIICEEDGKKSPNLIVVVLLSGVTFGIYGIYWYYIQGKRLYEIAPRYGCDVNENGLFYILWRLFLPGIGGFVGTYKLFENLNKLGESYNNGIVTNEPLRKQKISGTQKVVFGVAVIFLIVWSLFVMILAVAVESQNEGLYADDMQVDETEEVSNEDPEKKKEEQTEKNVESSDIPEAAPEDAEAIRAEYIFPDSAEKYLSEDEVRRVEADKLFIGRNEIFARHGYLFKDEGLKQHFAATSWYKGTVKPEDFNAEQVFNDFEKKNVELIKKVEDEINGTSTKNDSQQTDSPNKNKQADPEVAKKQAVIDEAYNFIVGKQFNYPGYQMIIEFTPNGELIDLGYNSVYHTYIVSAEFVDDENGGYYYPVLIIDGEENMFDYNMDLATIFIYGHGDFCGEWVDVNET